MVFTRNTKLRDRNNAATPHSRPAPTPTLVSQQLNCFHVMAVPNQQSQTRCPKNYIGAAPEGASQLPIPNRSKEQHKSRQEATVQVEGSGERGGTHFGLSLAQTRPPRLVPELPQLWQVVLPAW